MHASIAQAMADQGDFVTPRYLGRPFLDKPILFFWMQAASLSLSEDSAAAVRRPGLLSALLAAVTTGLVGRAFFTPGVGLLAALFYATSLVPFSFSQFPGPDIALVPWTNLAMLALWRALQKDAPARRLRQVIEPGLWLALAGLTKGFAGVALVTLPVAAWALYERRGLLAIATVLAGALALALVAAGPWYLAMERVHDGYLRYYFVERHLLGYFTGSQPHGASPWWYYGPVVLAGALPWALYLPFAARRPVHALSAPRASAKRLVFIWLVADLVFLSVAGSKLATYALPVFPAVAVLAALGWQEVRHAAAAGVRGGGVPWAIGAHVAVGAALLPLCFVLTQHRFDLTYPTVVWGATGLVAIGYAIAAYWWGIRPPAHTLTLCLILLVTTLLVVMTLVLPRVMATHSAEALGLYFNTHRTFPAHLWVFDERPASLPFYLTDELRARLTPSTVQHVNDATLAERLTDPLPGDTLLAIRDRRLKAVRRTSAIFQMPYVRAGEFRLYRVADLQRLVADAGLVEPGASSVPTPPGAGGGALWAHSSR